MLLTLLRKCVTFDYMEPTFSIRNEGTVVAITAHNDAALTLIHDNLATESWQWLGNYTVVVDHRFAEDVVNILVDAGGEIV